MTVMSRHLLCQVLRVIVNSVEPVATDKDHSIRENGLGNGKCRRNSDSGHHGSLCFLCNQTWIEFDKIRMVVQMAQLISDLGITVDLFESLVRLEAKELAELVQRGQPPFS